MKKFPKINDNKIARIFLSALIGNEIVELEFQPTEFHRKIDPKLRQAGALQDARHLSASITWSPPWIVRLPVARQMP
jgi:hypothetical protein